MTNEEYLEAGKLFLSMKMENTICADEDGTVEEIYVNAEEDLEAGKLLLKMKEN